MRISLAPLSWLVSEAASAFGSGWAAAVLRVRQRRTSVVSRAFLAATLVVGVGTIECRMSVMLWILRKEWEETSTGGGKKRKREKRKEERKERRDKDCRNDMMSFTEEMDGGRETP